MAAVTSVPGGALSTSGSPGTGPFPSGPPSDTSPDGRQALPVADFAEVRRYSRVLARDRSRDLIVTVGLFSLAAIGGLVGPRLLGSLIDSVQHGTTAGHVDRVIAAIAGFLVIQT